LFKLKNENALYVEYNCEHTLRCRSWTYQLKVTTQTKAVGQSMVYRQKPDCIIQNGTAGKRGKKGRSGKCLQYRHRYKGDSVCVFIGKFYLMKIGYMFIRILFMLLSYTFWLVMLLHSLKLQAHGRWIKYALQEWSHGTHFKPTDL